MATFTLDESDKAYSTDDWKRDSLKLSQIYNWRILKTEATKSKNGNHMAVLEVAPVTESGAVLKQFTKKVYMLIPVKSMSEGAYKFALRKYFSIVQSFVRGNFNAFSKIQDGKYYDAQGNELDREGKAKAINDAKARMLDAREEILSYLEPGQEAFAALLPPEEGKTYPEIGNFTQDVPADSALPFADNVKEMLG